MKTLTVHCDEEQEKVVRTLLDYLRIPFETAETESRDWQRLTAEQFLNGYDEADAVYDTVKSQS